MQRFLYWKKRSTYDDLKAAGIRHMFCPVGRCPFTVASAEQLSVQYTLQPPTLAQEPTAAACQTSWLPCGAMLVDGKMLFVDEVGVTL